LKPAEVGLPLEAADNWLVEDRHRSVAVEKRPLEEEGERGRKQPVARHNLLLPSLLGSVFLEVRIVENPSS
jgi:hypothetical protein